MCDKEKNYHPDIEIELGCNSDEEETDTLIFSPQIQENGCVPQIIINGNDPLRSARSFSETFESPISIQEKPKKSNKLELPPIATWMRTSWETVNKSDRDRDDEMRKMKQHHIEINCTENCIDQIHSVARKADPEKLKALLDQSNSDPNAKDCMGRSPLIWACSLECGCDGCVVNAEKCVGLLLRHPNCDINMQDFHGDSALHIAAENLFTSCCELLLVNGANVSIKNNRGVKALTIIVEKTPKALDALLDRGIIIEKYDIHNVKCEVKLDFGSIVRYSENNKGLPKNNINNNNDKSKPNALDNVNSVLHLNNFKSRKETHLLKYILEASSSSRKKILTHPLISIFLYLKWRKVRPFFWATILFHVMLLFIYTIYILDVYLISCPYRPKITDSETVREAKEEGYVFTENDTYIHEYIQFSWFSFKPEIKAIPTEDKLMLEGSECKLEIGPTVKSILLLTLTIAVTINEIFRLLPDPRSYLRSRNNKLQWTLFVFIYVSSWPVFMASPNISFWQYQTAAFGIFLGWSMMLLQVGKFPKLGIYVAILQKVMKNFGFFMLTYACLFIAFVMAFCVLFPVSINAPFASIPLSILKVLILAIGEVDYEELFYGKEELPVDDLFYPITGHLLFAAFVLMITIVLMNLLVGLTVQDIQGLRQDAQLAKITRQIAEISQLESFIFSKRVQSCCVGSLGNWLRKSILVVPRKFIVDEACEEASSENEWFFTFRPNDPNDKSLPEELKKAVIKFAKHEQRMKKTNKCHQAALRESISVPMIEEEEKTINVSTASIPLKNVDILEGYHKRKGNSFMATSNVKVNQDLEVLFMKFEEKIMERIKIQMDFLYQKIEERISEK